MFGDMVVSLLEEVLTTVERTLVQEGRAESVRDVRLTFQSAMEERFTAVVEELTGREVVSFMSAVDVDRETAVEIFLLAPTAA